MFPPAPHLSVLEPALADVILTRCHCRPPSTGSDAHLLGRLLLRLRSGDSSHMGTPRPELALLVRPAGPTATAGTQRWPRRRRAGPRSSGDSPLLPVEQRLEEGRRSAAPAAAEPRAVRRRRMEERLLPGEDVLLDDKKKKKSS